MRVRPKDRRPPSRFIQPSDDSFIQKEEKKVEKNLEKEEKEQKEKQQKLKEKEKKQDEKESEKERHTREEHKKDDTNETKTITSIKLDESNSEDSDSEDSDIFNQKSITTANKHKTETVSQKNNEKLFKSSPDKSKLTPSSKKITKPISDENEDELFGTKVKNIPTIQVPKSKPKSITETRAKKTEGVEKEQSKLVSSDDDDDIFKPKNSRTLIKKDSDGNLFENTSKKNTKNLFDSDDSDLDIFKRSPPKKLPDFVDDDDDDGKHSKN